MKNVLCMLVFLAQPVYAADWSNGLGIDTSSPDEPVEDHNSMYFINRYDDGKWSVNKIDSDGGNTWITPIYNQEGEVSTIIEREYE